MRGSKFTVGARNTTWAALYVTKGYENDDYFRRLTDKMIIFQEALTTLGINMGKLQPREKAIVGGDRGYAEVDNKIKVLAARAKLLIVVLPAVDTALYKRIKLVGDVEVGVHTVCVVFQNFMKERNDQYLANVGLKINLKLGGVNQVAEPKGTKLIQEDKTMVVGIDVTHPAPGSPDSAPSVAGMVASVDKSLGQWPADLRIQASRQEMVADLDSMLKSRLQLWKQKGKHASLPENILVYRDGVSEGQYATVLNDELPLLRKACNETYSATERKNNLPRFTIVIVGKRHHTRFYPTTDGDADRQGNTKNGTVVDRGVTEARNWDFFLQAHSALKGTARPAHYHVVLDEIFPKRRVSSDFQNPADVLEDLTHSMCYSFGRATKAVSICPPAYYADIVCERGRCYLSRIFDHKGSAKDKIAAAKPDEVVVHAALKNSMFYI